MRLTVGSLFAGIGGFDLAAEAMGWDTRWFVEWDPQCQFWLVEHFPGRPIYGDITAVNFREIERVDILCGGFPCQPVSAAGKRAAQRDDRWLWPEFARAIRQLRPRYVAIENTPGLLSAGLTNGGGVYEVDETGLDDRTAGAVRRALGDVLRDLATLGYDARWDVLSIADIGGPHQRERVWIVAHANRHVTRSRAGELRGQPEPSRRDHVEGRGESVGDPDSRRREQRDAIERRHEEPVPGHVAMGDPASGGRGTREGIEIRRTGGEHPGVGHAVRRVRADAVCCRGVVDRVPTEEAVRALVPLWNALVWIGEDGDDCEAFRLIDPDVHTRWCMGLRFELKELGRALRDLAAQIDEL